MVNIEDLEAEFVLLWLVVFTEGHQECYEINNRDLCAVIAVRHPEVEHLAKVWLIDPDHILDVLDEVLLCQHAHAVYVAARNLVVFALAAPEKLKTVHNGLELRFGPASILPVL